jgi:hypothetical protein
MQYDPNKQGYNNQGNVYANQYPPMNQPQFGAGNPYPPNNAPPVYGQYPQQPGYYGQPPVYQTQGVVITPVYRTFWNNVVLTPITPSLKAFMVISGIIYLLWSVLAFGLEIGLIANGSVTYYRGLWAGAFILGGAISMLIAACRQSYNMAHLIGMFAVALVFCILGLILSIVNYAASSGCTYSFYYYCDSQLALNLKIVILVVFLFATIHTIVNMIIVGNAQKNRASTPAPGVPGQ